jgi:hypothetical protein
VPTRIATAFRPSLLLNRHATGPLYSPGLRPAWRLSRLNDPAYLAPIAEIAASLSEDEAKQFETLLATMTGQEDTPLVEIGKLVVTTTVSGLPLAGARVDVSSVENGGTVATEKSGPDGVADFELPGAKRYQLSCGVAGGDSQHASHRVSQIDSSLWLPPGGSVQHTFMFHYLTGRVIAADGTAVVGAKIDMLTHATAMKTRGPYAIGIYTRTNSNGGFQFIAASGPYTLRLAYGGSRRELDVAVREGDVDTGPISLL